MLRWIKRWWTQRRLNKLLAWSRTHQMTPEEHEAQRRSFVYGNVKLSNPDVTREMVDEAADRMAAEGNGQG